MTKKTEGISEEPEFTGCGLEAYDHLSTDEGTGRCELETPNEEPLLNSKGEQMWVDIRSVDSPAYRRIAHKIKQRRFKKGRNVFGDNPDENVQETAKLLAACATNWGNFEHNGKELKFSVVAAEDVFARYPFIADQLDRYMANRANFMKR